MRTGRLPLIAFAVALVALTGRLRAQRPNDEFDQWLDAATTALRFDAGAAWQPGDAILYSIATCVDGKLQTWSISLDRSSGSPRMTDRGGRTPTDCAPGTGPNGAPIAGPGILSGGRAPGRAILPPFRRVPFLPLYPASSFPDAALGCVAANNSSALVANYLSGAVRRVATCTGKLGNSIQVAPHPLQLATSQDGTLALATSFDNAVSFIDTASDSVVFTLQTPAGVNPSGVAISPDGSAAYVTSINAANPALVFIDVPGRRITRTVPLGAFPQSVFVSPDGALAWVTHPTGNQIDIVDTLTGTVNRQIAIEAPYAVAFDSTGSKAYITSGTAGLVVIETTAYGRVQTVGLAAGAVDVLLTPDGGLIVAASYEGKSISLIHPDSYAVSTVALGGAPRGLALVE